MKYCQKCGKEIADNAVFCAVCGTKQDALSPTANMPKTVTMVCSKCSGTMTVDEQNNSVVCPYCGSRELILESDAVKVEKIKTEAQKEIEFKRLEQENRVLDEQAKEKHAQEVKRRKLPVVALVFGIISLLFAVMILATGKISTGFITMIQALLFIFSFVSGKELIPVDFGKVFVLSAVAGWIVYIPCFISIIG
ncbi:MAG: zinc-ribbon domain-containing protein [Ruminococcus sp.]|nr:zinc-ribbon domain-containing protein [Ruminococcus sp.]